MLRVSVHGYRAFFGHRVVWQEGVRLNPNLRPGDVLVIPGNPRFLSNLPLIVSARKRWIAVVWWGHGWTAGSFPFLALFRRQLMRLADVLLLYTDREAKQFVELGFPSEHVFSINNGIDQKPIRAAAAEWPNNRIAEFRVEQQLVGQKLLLFCGRLTGKAKLDLALRALPILLANGNYKLAVIGDGHEEQSLRSLCRRLDVEQHVRWLGSMLEQRDMAPWFLAADCFIYPGAIGLSLLHAFGYGLPVVTHNNLRNQMPEIAALRHLENGYLYREGEINSLMEGVRYICEDTARRRLMGDAALAVSKDYSLETMLERFLVAVRAAARRPDGAQIR
jgi:glycosyltransferase involved in cell wall biosynthesis